MKRYYDSKKEQFRPIYLYLHKRYSSAAVDRIIQNLLFISEKEGQFCYKNKVTRGNVVVSGEGHLIHCASTALRTITDYLISPYKRRDKKLYS